MSSSLRPPSGVHWKYAVRLAGVPLAARLGRRLGVGWRRLGEILGREVLVAQVRRTDKSSVNQLAENQSTERPLRIVFASMMSGYTHFAAIEFVLALLLEARGHKVEAIICDQAFPICEVKKAGIEERWESLCGKCYAFGRKFHDAAGTRVATVSELSRDAVPEARWDDIVGSALLKHFKVGTIDVVGDSSHDRTQLLGQSAAISASVGRYLVDIRPDRVVMTHGIYTTWQPMRELLVEAGIPVITYDKAKKKGTWNFNWNHESAWWDVAEEWERVKRTTLSAIQETRVDEYLASRRSHSNDVLRYNFGDEEGRIETLRRFDLNPDVPIFALFTNVLWDAASTDREIVFHNPIDWVFQTIRWFADHPDRQLVVKIHPAEMVIGTNQPFASIIAREFPQLPPNVRLIEPHEEVNSWSIISVADLGLVHTSTVGMEMPLEGVPCAVVSRTHYRDKGFTIDVASKDEYFRLLETFDRSDYDVSQSRELARRYAYLLFERYQLPFPFIYEMAYADVRALDFERIGEIRQLPLARLLVECIEAEKPFLLPNEC